MFLNVPRQMNIQPQRGPLPAVVTNRDWGLASPLPGWLLFIISEKMVLSGSTTDPVSEMCIVSVVLEARTARSSCDREALVLLVLLGWQMVSSVLPSL